MTQFAALIRLVFLVLAVSFGTGAALAQDAPPPADVLKAFDDQATALEGRLENGAVLDDALESDRAAMEAFRQQLTDIAAEAQAEAAPILEEQKALGPAPEGDAVEAPEIARQRADLAEQLADIDARDKRAQQEAARARALIDKLNDLRRTRFTERLMARGPSPLQPDQIAGGLQGLADKARTLWTAMAFTLEARASRGTLVDEFALPLFAIIVALLVTWLIRRWVVRTLYAAAGPDASPARAVTLGTLITASRLLLMSVVLIMIAGGLSEGLFPAGQVTAFGWGLVNGAALLIAASALGRAYYAPSEPHLRISSLTDGRAALAYRLMMALATVAAAYQLFIETGDQIALPIRALNIANATILVLGGFALAGYVQWAGIGKRSQVEDGPKDDDDPGAEAKGTPAWVIALRLFRLVAMAVAVLSPILALVGYYGASQFIFYPLLASMAVVGICLLVYRIVLVLCAPRAESADPAKDAEDAPVTLLPVLTGFLLISGALPILALIWGADTTDLVSVWAQVVEGFQVGDVTIAPIDFLLFLLVFAVGYIVTRMMQSVVRRSVLPLTRMDEGARSASLAGIGYVGVVVAALIAISAAGLDLSNLAIVAGALSVGIGFGLQNVVNNFVSGIILLIERPIKTGDWVEIGGTHGTVRKVNVRSTEIQTFDRSTMFVPNADLISGTVTNWTHGNSLGRIIVGVGVAYGSDARQVEKILLEIARAHTMLTRRPAPYVIFAGFGADSLDFEIRGVLRDVNWILNVGSDLRFSIYERFQEEGIEIPFAQRDIMIKNLGDLRPSEPPKSTPQPINPVPPAEGPDADAD